MKFQKFEDIIAWQKAQDLGEMIYSNFKTLSDYGFRNQLCRAVLSISNNIAEGSDKGTHPEFRRFLRIALGSASEVKSMLYMAKRLNYITHPHQELLIEKVSEISKIINGLIKSLKL